MTTEIETTRRQAEHGSPGKVKTAFGAAAGTCVENYDFVAYGTASALYFGDVFFPESDPVTGTLLSFATLGVGFLMRPIGGSVGGFLGDRYGRKPVLVGALLIMGVATVLIGLLPTYAQVGVLAPVLLVLIRMIQGLAFGAEWGGAVLMAYEHAPWRHRGRFAAIPQAGNPLGIALANIAFLASASLDSDWAWRIPFLASAILIAVGLFVRMRLSESPEFVATKALGEVVRNPFLTVIKEDWRNILRVIALRVVESCAYYLTATYLLSYIAQRDPADRTPALTGVVIASVIAVGTTLFAGNLTDRIGRRRVYLVGCLLAIAFGIPMYLLANTGQPFLIAVVFIIGIGLIHAVLTGTQAAWFAELFATNRRTSGASIGYQTAASIAGFAPFLAVLLADGLGWIGPALFYVTVGLVGLGGVLATRETWGPKERAGVDAFIRGEAGATAR
ncbi:MULTISPECIES: MFS transporter [Mycolicibacterium]|uniref:MHS family MFS transporter n=2 Tax=Mycolicibacterium TaxID=1866885 RepID=A0A9X2YIK7_9MYCO|nr:MULTISPECIES: MFS transporter [Mycolicibacterium]MCV7168613.1 MHS family MFS transporter [[Mycobacterium] manitobense]MDO3636275.1 MFS transporter [Mycolicibacterium arseniciresistens]